MSAQNKYKNSDQRVTLDFHKKKDEVLSILHQSETKLTARAYIEKIAARLSVSRRTASKILRTLVEEQELAYQDLYGATYVDISFSKPVQITKHFRICPPHFNDPPDPVFKDIVIHPGISFGSGHHPTTRMCLKAIEHVFFNQSPMILDQMECGADIGTGSGILAIALCRSGVNTCMAWDIDPNAVAEARQNIAACGLSKKIRIEQSFMPAETHRYAVICANLRFPTLKKLSGLIIQNLKSGGCVILSGIREWEKTELVAHYKNYGLKMLWQSDEKQWSAVVLKG